MPSRIAFLLWVAAVALIGASCSSNSTIVERADRPDPAAAGSAADSEESADPVEPDDNGDSGDSDDGIESGSPSVSSPRELEEASGFGLGGQDQLNALLVDCEAGNNQACDVLAQLSTFDSVEEAAALTCGGRSETEVVFCTEGIVGDVDTFAFDESSPGLEPIVAACEDGDMTACDFLYFRSPLGSTYETLGNTCGGRAEVALPDCRTLFSDPG